MRPSRETFGERTRTHGMTNTRLYSVWCGIKDRCYNKNLEHFDRYGGRGITVCKEWKDSFEAFAEWAVAAGYEESKTGKEQSLDRIDVNGDYCPENCRWVSMKTQARNRTDTVYIKTANGKIPAREFAEINGISDYVYLYRKIRKGECAEKILKDWNMKENTPSEYMNMREAVAYYGVSEQSIRSWIKEERLSAIKSGQKWFILKGQEVKRRVDRGENMRFLPSKK